MVGSLICSMSYWAFSRMRSDHIQSIQVWIVYILSFYFNKYHNFFFTLDLNVNHLQVHCISISSPRKNISKPALHGLCIHAMVVMLQVTSKLCRYSKWVLWKETLSKKYVSAVCPNITWCWYVTHTNSIIVFIIMHNLNQEQVCCCCFHAHFKRWYSVCLLDCFVAISIINSFMFLLGRYLVAYMVYNANQLLHYMVIWTPPLHCISCHYIHRYCIHFAFPFRCRRKE
jgi:hypothetical protein